MYLYVRHGWFEWFVWIAFQTTRRQYNQFMKNTQSLENALIQTSIRKHRNQAKQNALFVYCSTVKHMNALKNHLNYKHASHSIYCRLLSFNVQNYNQKVSVRLNVAVRMQNVQNISQEINWNSENSVFSFLFLFFSSFFQLFPINGA